jgi:hypothetical protein
MADAWFDAAKGDAHTALWPYVQHLAETYMMDRLTAYETYLGMLGDNESVGVYPSRTIAQSTLQYRGAHLTLNVSRALVDTAVAKITQARPRPYFLTYGGDFESQQKAKNLQRAADGLFDENKAYRVGCDTFRDTCGLGTGAVKIVKKKRNGKCRPALERTLASEIIVDEALAWGRTPLEMFQRKEVSQTGLAAAFPKQRAAIMSLTTLDTLAGGAMNPDLVVVYEGWRLPIGAQKGRHVILTQSSTLLDEEWCHEWFPFAFLRWYTPSVGFYGHGIPQQVLGMQVEINRILRSISKNIHLHGNPRVLLPNNSKVNPAAITNGWGDIVTYEGMKPEIWLAQTLSPEVYRYLMDLYEKCFELTGLSQQAAFAKREPGVTAARAIAELSDIQGDRLSPISQEYEEFYLDLTRKLLATAEDIYKNDKENLEIASVENNVANRIRWSEVRMDENDFVMQLFPANFLSRTPAKKVQDIDILMDRGLLNPDQAKRLFDFPDLKQVLDEDSSPSELYLKQINLSLKDGTIFTPEPHEVPTLPLGIQLYRNYLMRARMEDASEERLDILREWIDAAEYILQQATQPPPTQQQALAPQPDAAMPMPTPI